MHTLVMPSCMDHKMTQKWYCDVYCEYFIFEMCYLTIFQDSKNHFSQFYN